MPLAATMERKRAHLAYVNAFYYPSAVKDVPPYQGYIRIKVSNYIRSEAAPIRTTPHGLFHPIYFRFSLPRNSPSSFSLDERPLVAENIAPPYSERKEWKISELTKPSKMTDRELLEILVRRINSSPSFLLASCKNYRIYNPRQRRSFLNHFAMPIREGLEEKTWYGTIEDNPILITVRESDFRSYHEERQPSGLVKSNRFWHDRWSF